MRNIAFIILSIGVFISANGQTNTFPSSGNVGVGTVNPVSKLHVQNNNVGIKSQHSAAVLESIDAQFDIISSSDGTWGSSINLIEGNGASNKDIWSISRQTTNGNGDSSLRFNFGSNNQHVNSNVVTFRTNRKVGIGTTSPLNTLHVANSGRTGVRIGGPNTSNGAVSDLIFSPSNGGKIGDSNYWYWSFRTDSWANTPGDLVLYSHNGTSYTSPIIVQSDGDVALVTGNGALRNGNVGIGTNNPDSKLTVKGKVHAEEVKVDLSVPAPDYVFKEGYNLRSLEEVQDYINKNGHLPNIPSAKEMETNGVKLGIMNMKLLEKIEELTLYLLKQEKEINKLKKQNRRLETLEKGFKAQKEVIEQLLTISKSIRK